MPRFAPTALLFQLCLAVAPFASAQGMNAEAKAWCARAVPALKNALKVQPERAAQSAAISGDLRYLKWFGVASAVPGI